MSEFEIQKIISEDNHPDESELEVIGPEGLVKKIFSFVGELLRVVIISLAIILPIRYFLIQPFYVKGASMEPNFYDHEYLIIDEISYRFSEPQRGDIVVFRYPDDPSQFFIKRVIGLPGERVVISNGRIRIINHQHSEGFILEESSYLDQDYTSGEKDLTLLGNEYYLLGDNRAASMDSRSFGPVSRNLIVGRAALRGWPPDKMGFFTGVIYEEDLVVIEDNLSE